MKIFPSLGTVIDRLCIVAGAFLGSQIPQFMQQYASRLSGHVAELQLLIDQLRKVAAHSNKSLEEYIQKFLSSSDGDFAYQGKFMQGMVVRWEELNNALTHLAQSSAWTRPLVFVKDLQSDIAHSTLTSFQPGINLSLEGLCYAGIGCLLGWAFYQLISKGFKFAYGWIRSLFNWEQFNRAFRAKGT